MRVDIVLHLDELDRRVLSLQNGADIPVPITEDKARVFIENFLMDILEVGRDHLGYSIRDLTDQEKGSPQRRAHWDRAEHLLEIEARKRYELRHGEHHGTDESDGESEEAGEA